MLNATERLRAKYTLKTKAKKTLSLIELFEYIVKARNEKANIAASATIKKLRAEGYSISQSRVFDIFKDLEAEEAIDKEEALKARLKPAELKKLKAEQAAMVKLEAEMKKMQAELELKKEALAKQL